MGTEGKTTVNSVSTLFLIQGSNNGRLRLCRVGSDFRMYRWLQAENGWTLEHTFARPDMPATLQAGAIANGYQPPPDLHARYDYVRFGAVQNVAGCTGTLLPL